MGYQFLSTVLCASLSLVSPTVLTQFTLASPTVSSSWTSQPGVGTIQPARPMDLSDEETLGTTAQQLGAIALLIGAIALSIGIYQYNRNENWYRIEFLRKAVREFEEDPEIWKALKILDFEEYRDYEIIYGNKRITFQVTNELLCAALGTHDERAKRKKEIDSLKAQGKLEEKHLIRYHVETTVRDWFNQMLNGLEHFGYFVESRMFTANEIRPWMIYWIRLIADRQYKRPNASKFYDQLYTYINAYGFSGVIKLFDRFGYRLLPTPYQESDFTDLSQGLSGYDLRTALSLAKAAQLIYEDINYVTEISERWGVDVQTGFRYFDNMERDTQAFMFKTDAFMILAFRGSQESKDWQTNFSTRMKKIALTTKLEPQEEDWSPPRGQVHRGFQSAWEGVERSVVYQIRQWNAGRKQPLPLFITGHSLGGALATVAAGSLVKRKIPVQGLYTFGQPRAGDVIFVHEIGTALQGKAFRFVNNNDIVPHVPPPYLPWNPLRIYKHMGKMYYFNARGGLTSRPNPIVRFLDFLIGILRDSLEPGFDAINDHRMEYYISNLTKALEVEQTKQRLLQEDKLR